MIRESSQNALERYFAMNDDATCMSQQAFSEARQKIKWEAFREMFDFTATVHYKNNEVLRCNGFRLYAIDGSKLLLPNDKPLRSYFGTSGPGSKSPTAQVSILYDILNDLVVDALIEPMKISEQAQARTHINHLEGIESFWEWQELVIFDRGYSSRELMQSLLDKKIHYLMRIRTKFSTVVDALGLGDYLIELEHDKNRIPVRVIKFLLPGGEVETLLTSLMDTKYGVEDFKVLYFKRWSIETKYDVLKKKLEIENFSGRIVDNIRQDFYATMVLTNLAADFFWAAQAEIDDEQEQKENKYHYQVNLNHAIGVLKDNLIKTLLEEDGKKRGEMFDRTIELLKKRLIPIRPGRSLPRGLPRKAKFHHNHKSNC
jgi:hypothetical protein